MMKKIYINYSREDGRFVKQLHRSLRQKSVDAWAKGIDVPVGQIWVDHANRELRTRDVMLAVHSPDFDADIGAQHEVSFFDSLGKSIISLLYGECEAHVLLFGRTEIDFTDETDFDSAFVKLCEALEIPQSTEEKKPDLRDHQNHGESLSMYDPPELRSGKQLSTRTFEQLVDILVPLMKSEKAREGIFTTAFCGVPHLQNSIDYSGPSVDFIPPAIQKSEDFGEIENGKSALGVLLGVCRNRVGGDKRTYLDALRKMLDDKKGAEAVSETGDAHSTDSPESSVGADENDPIFRFTFERSEPLIAAVEYDRFSVPVTSQDLVLEDSGADSATSSELAQSSVKINATVPVFRLKADPFEITPAMQTSTESEESQPCTVELSPGSPFKSTDIDEDDRISGSANKSNEITAVDRDGHAFTVEYGKERQYDAESEIYVSQDGEYAIKLYYEEVRPKKNLDILRGILSAQPDPRNPIAAAFAWPIALILDNDNPNQVAGVLMPNAMSEGGLKTLAWYRSIKVVRSLPSEERGTLKGRVEVAIIIARAMRWLYRAGYAQGYISGGNYLIDPVDGRVVLVNLDGLVFSNCTRTALGKASYMASELVEADLNNVALFPNVYSDRHSLAVVLHELLLMHHPFLNGRRPPLDENVGTDDKLRIGAEAIYVQHPTNDINRPIGPFIPLDTLTQELQDLFLLAFVEHLHEPIKRPRPDLWEVALKRLLEDLVECENEKCLWRAFPSKAQTVSVCPMCGTSRRKSGIFTFGD